MAPSPRGSFSGKRAPGFEGATLARCDPLKRLRGSFDEPAAAPAAPAALRKRADRRRGARACVAMVTSIGHDSLQTA